VREIPGIHYVKEEVAPAELVDQVLGPATAEDAPQGGLLRLYQTGDVVVRRGIIKSARTRGAGTALDEYDRAEMDALWPGLEALFTWGR